jgi:hypothetical protein
MKLLATCLVLAALAGCAAQQRHSDVDFSPSDRAAMVSALLAHQHPLTVYQQPFYPMQPSQGTRPCCWY